MTYEIVFGQLRPRVHAVSHHPLGPIEDSAGSGETALLTSANFTVRGLADNLEVGLLVRDREIAGRLEAHLRSLMQPQARCLSRVE